MDKQEMHPLLLPEIILRLGLFIPLWIPDRSSPTSFRIEPYTFLSCLSVNRLWRKLLLPLFWRVYDDQALNRFHKLPLNLLFQSCHYFRFCGMRFTHLASLLTKCTQLQELTLRLWIHDDLSTQCFLQNPRLQLLDLGSVCPQGRPMTEQNYVDLLSLNSLQVLNLSGWKLDQQMLSALLSQNRMTLRELTLLDIEGLDDTVLWVELPNLTFLEIGCDQPDSSLALPHLVTFCPALQTLALQMRYDSDYTLVANLVGQSCLNLDSLFWVTEYDSSSISVLLEIGSHARMIQELTHRPNQLRRYKTTIENFDDITLKALLEHAESLESVRLFIAGDDPQHLFTNVNTLLEKCPNLKELSLYNMLMDWDADAGMDLLKGNWACQGLEILELDGISCIKRQYLDRINAEEMTETKWESYSDSSVSEPGLLDQNEDQRVSKDQNSSDLWGTGNEAESGPAESSVECTQNSTVPHKGGEESEQYLESQSSNPMDEQLVEETLSNSYLQQHETRLHNEDTNAESQGSPSRSPVIGYFNPSNNDLKDEWSVTERNNMELARLRHPKNAVSFGYFPPDVLPEGWKLPPGVSLPSISASVHFLWSPQGREFREALEDKMKSLPCLKKITLNQQDIMKA